MSDACHIYTKPYNYHNFSKGPDAWLNIITFYMLDLSQLASHVCSKVNPNIQTEDSKILVNNHYSPSTYNSKSITMA